MSFRTNQKKKNYRNWWVVFIERIQHRNHYVICVVSGPTLVYWAAVIGVGLTGLVHCRLQGCVFRAVLYHTLQLPTMPVWALETDLPARSRSVSSKKGNILEEEEEEETKKYFFHFVFLSDLREKNREGKCFLLFVKMVFQSLISVT